MATSWFTIFYILRQGEGNSGAGIAKAAGNDPAYE